MKNLHLIATDKPSRLCINGKNQMHIYITSDEEIKEGDWYFDGTDLVHKKTKYNDSLVDGNKQAKKIILTTDQDLIEDGVQKIDDNFLEWFVKNPSCESVEVLIKNKTFDKDGFISSVMCDTKKVEKIYSIIPQEEPKQEPTLENAKLALREYILANKEKVTEDLQEMRKKSGNGRDETLKEVKDLSYYKANAEENYLAVPISVLRYISELEERMYSEEDFKLFARQYYREIKMDKSNLLWTELADKCLEQFKKK
jgi:hypothetical protein